MTLKARGMLRFSHAVFARAFGNRWRTRAHIQPNDLKSGNRNRLKKKVLGNKSKGAKARCRCTPKQIRKIIWYRAKPIQQYVGKDFLNLQKKLGITEGSTKEELGETKKNILIWGLFMSSSMKAAIHFGQIFTKNLPVFKNTHVEYIQNLFNITQRLVTENSEEILNVKAFESSDPFMVKKTRMSHPQVIKWTQVTVHVYSDSVLRLGKLSFSSEAAQRWKGQLIDLLHQELFEVDGEPIEFKWNLLPELTSLEILRKIQDDLRSRNIKLEDVGYRVIFMSMFNDIVGTREAMKKSVFQIPNKSEIM